MSTKQNCDIRRIEDTDAPLLINPANIKCGFLLFPSNMAHVLQESHVHQALQQNKNALWTAVRQLTPDIPVHLITSTMDINPVDAIVALDTVGSGKYSDCAIAFDVQNLSPDGGKTLVTIFVGFCYMSHYKDVVIAGPQKILPGKLQPSASQRKDVYSESIEPPKKNS